MKRREFITLVGGAGVAWPLAAHAQETGRIARIGVLGPSLDNAVTGPAYQVFISELRKLGFTQGQNLIVDHRRSDEGTAKAFAGANELVAEKAEVLVTWGPEIGLQAAAAVRPPVDRHASDPLGMSALLQSRPKFGATAFQLELSQSTFGTINR